MEFKTAHKTVRFTQKSYALIEKICDELNKYNIHVNGEAEEVYPSNLITHFFEKLAHDKEKKEIMLAQFLQIIEITNREGQPPSPEITHAIIKEIFNAQ